MNPLDDNWTPIIEKDVDGADSLPLRTDAEQHAQLHHQEFERE